ncbi:hypothetical protein BJX68DRAFT_237571 [Aspergillus pseudodeflectus]|uniref:Uncharacterized protein n=1 Tax=Aspergillus pseudodeflectus TaxID=176178 RepID=A0ABR4KBQ8_9EURO
MVWRSKYCVQRSFAKQIPPLEDFHVQCTGMMIGTIGQVAIVNWALDNIKGIDLYLGRNRQMHMPILADRLRHVYNRGRDRASMVLRPRVRVQIPLLPAYHRRTPVRVGSLGEEGD